MPTEYGGLGLGPEFGAVVSEELARCGSGGFAAGIGAHMGIASPPIERFGTPEQKERWLAPAMRAEKIGALAITEPGGGSDVASARTRAERVDGGWVVSGEKTYITNGVRADFYVTAVRTTSDGGHGGMSFLVIEKGEGVSTSALHKLGWHASDTATVAFDDVFVPEDHLLGELNKGFYLIMANFQGERLGMSLTALGEMRASFERLVEWAAALPPASWRRHAVAELGLKVELAAAISYGCCPSRGRRRGHRPRGLRGQALHAARQSGGPGGVRPAHGPGRAGFTRTCFAGRPAGSHRRWHRRDHAGDHRAVPGALTAGSPATSRRG